MSLYIPEKFGDSIFNGYVIITYTSNDILAKNADSDSTKETFLPPHHRVST